MRRLAPLLFLCACASSTPKRSVSDIDIDVPWEEQQIVAEEVPERPVPPKAKAKQAQSKQAQSKQAQSKRAKRTTAKPVLHTTTYHLTWQGRRIGEARETFHRSESGVRIIRHEEIHIKRSGVPVRSETEIIIEADAKLRATRVELRASAGAVTRQGHAVRADDGQWVIALEGEPVRKAPANSVPIELVPYLVAQNGESEYRGKVLLAGYGFAVTDVELEHNGRVGRSVLKTAWGDIKTNLKMKDDGTLARAATGSTGSVRVGSKRLAEKFTPPELPGTSSIPITGEGNVLLVQNTSRQPPPAVGGQSISVRKNGWRVQFEDKGRVQPRIASLAREVDSLLKDSHDAPGAGASDALALGRGDCTAHATLFVDLAAEQNISAKLVTGFRVDGNKLVRHRWVSVKQGAKWIHVDPTFGEAPISRATHLALAVHGDSTAEIALVDEAVFRGLEKAKATWVPESVATRVQR